MRIFFIVFCVLNTSLIYSQNQAEVPELPGYIQYELPVERSSRLYYLGGSLFDTIAPRFEAPKKEYTESEARSELNKLLIYARKMHNLDSVDLSYKIPLFQSVESLKTNKMQHVFLLSDTLHCLRSDPEYHVQTTVYNDYLQRDIWVSSGNDSTRITNWYVKQFTVDELRKLTDLRSNYQEQIDSLKLKMLEMKKSGMFQYGNEINAVRYRVEPLERITDSIDYIVYPSIKKDIIEFLKRTYGWQSSHNIDFKAWDVTRNSNYREGNDKIEFRTGEKTDFIKKRFRLIYAIKEGHYNRRSAYFGDSTIYSGAEILNRFMCEDLCSGSSEWRRVLTVFDKKNLVVESIETHIGETYHYSTEITYWFELVE